MTRRQQFGPVEVRVWPGEGRAEIRKAGTLVHLVHGRAHALALTAFWDAFPGGPPETRSQANRDLANVRGALAFVLDSFPVENLKGPAR